MQLLVALEKYIGYKTFRPGQQPVIEAVIAQKDVVALLPTGMGKSLCYQLPGYILGGTVLIVSPLLSLMQDQVEQLKLNGEKRVVGLNSFLSKEEKEFAFQHLAEYRFIFISPEMLMNEFVQQRLLQLQLSLIVVDEAHCISQWGFDFRPDYLQITSWLPVNRPPVLALSATATKRVQQDICTYLQLQTPFFYEHDVDRPNIHYAVNRFESTNDKVEALLIHVDQYEGPGIIYTQSRKATVEYANRLLEKGLRVAAYHGGMEHQDRQLVQHQFITGQLDWVCATTAFGMGVHKENIRQVVHDHIPQSVAHYVQEVGRAGRDFKESIATLFYCPNDLEVTLQVIQHDLPTLFQIEQYELFQARKINPKEMIVQQSITETTFRVLHYWMTHYSTEQVKMKLQQLAIEKQQQLQAMQQIVTNERCIREQLVAYFGQRLQKQPHDCCTSCDLQRNIFLTEREKNVQDNNLASWEQRFATILSIN